jgi:ADP-ribose pyrophosphatase YjhB (NUDIX family)
MKFCSECGQPIARCWIADEARERYVCAHCGVTHYENPRIIVCVVVHWQDEVLLCRRACPPAQGQWSLPCGYLECGETLEAAAARETFEEAGVSLDPSALELYAIANMTHIEQVAVTFRSEIDVKPVLRAGPECLEVGFFSEEQTHVKDLAWRETFGNGDRSIFEQLRSREFKIQLASVGCAERGTTFCTREYLLRPSRLP